MATQGNQHRASYIGNFILNALPPMMGNFECVPRSQIKFVLSPGESSRSIRVAYSIATACRYDVIHAQNRKYITYHNAAEEGNIHRKYVEFGHVVREIRERTNIQTDRQADTLHHLRSPILGKGKVCPQRSVH